jgi:hypothetical protein
MFKNKPCIQEYVYDFAVDGGSVGQIRLDTKAGAKPIPSNAIIKAVYYNVETAMTSGGSATVSIGDVGASARYLALTAFDNAAYTANAPKAAAIGVPVKVTAANIGQFSVSVAVAALTAGKISFMVEYYIPALV